MRPSEANWILLPFEIYDIKNLFQTVKKPDTHRGKYPQNLTLPNSSDRFFIIK
jgi:hypothetical protein